MIGTQPQIILSAPIYRSFPLESVRAATRGRSVTMVGGVGAALRRSLPDTETAETLRWPPLDLASGDGADRLLGLLADCRKADWTIITEADAGQMILDHADIAFALRQITRRSAVFPVKVDHQRMRIAGYRGFSGHETNGEGQWRWIDSEDGRAGFDIWSLTDGVPVTFSFVAAICAPMTDGGTDQANLTIETGGHVHREVVSAGARVTMHFLLRRGANPVGIATDIPPTTGVEDSRTLSLAIFDPDISNDAGIIVGPADFLRGEGGPLGRIRARLHGAGFEGVTPYISDTSHMPTLHALPTSTGNPLHRILMPDEDFDMDDAAATDGICWFLCGEPPA